MGAADNDRFEAQAQRDLMAGCSCVGVIRVWSVVVVQSDEIGG